LMRKEIELAKQELGQSVGDKVKGAVVIAIAGFMAMLALMFGLLAVRDGVTEFFAPWISDLITAGGLLILGLLGALFAKAKLTKPIKADLTKESLREDVEWAKTLGRR